VRRGEDGEETTYFLAMAFHADNVVGVLVADKKFKFGSAI
jgi:hypothetical protein